MEIENDVAELLRNEEIKRCWKLRPLKNEEEEGKVGIYRSPKARVSIDPLFCLGHYIVGRMNHRREANNFLSSPTDSK